MTFVQRRHTDGQQVPEKMLNIINHQGNANQNHNDISFHTCQVAIIKKRKMTKEVEKLEPLPTLGGNVQWCNHYGKQNYGYDPVIPFLSIYQKELKSESWKRYWHFLVHCSTIHK